MALEMNGVQEVSAAPAYLAVLVSPGAFIRLWVKGAGQHRVHISRLSESRPAACKLCVESRKDRYVNIIEHDPCWTKAGTWASRWDANVTGASTASAPIRRIALHHFSEAWPRPGTTDASTVARVLSPSPHN